MVASILQRGVAIRSVCVRVRMSVRVRLTVCVCVCERGDRPVSRAVQLARSY